MAATEAQAADHRTHTAERNTTVRCDGNNSENTDYHG